MLHKIKEHFYSKITLICVILVIITTVTFMVICNHLIYEQKRVETLAEYDIALSRMNSALYTRLNSLTSIFSPVFEDEDSYSALCHLFLNPTEDYPSATSESVVQTLSRLCDSASYCMGCLLVNRNGRLYQYNPLYGSLSALPLRGTTFQFTPYECQLISDEQLSALSYHYSRPGAHVYGISGTLFTYVNDEVLNLGYIVPLYSTEEFDLLLAEAKPDKSAIFTISDKNGTLLYSSDGDTAEASKRLPLITGSNDSEEVNWDQQKWFCSYIWSEDDNFLFTYQVPEKVISHYNYQFILLLFGIGICTFCIMLYIVSFRISSKKIHNLQRGMEVFSHGNLDFRMKVPAQKDEFAQIITHFNKMCDDLQKNIEKAYVYELSQQKAELYAMQTSINPHFLYNSLEQIRVRALTGSVQDAANMLLLLSRMYRNQTRRNLYVSIAQECTYIENFMELYSYHYQNFDYYINIDSAAKIYGIPKNTLQPLLENYFIHGLNPDSDDNTIWVRCSFLETQKNSPALEFTVQDNGLSITPQRLTELEERLKTSALDRDAENGFALSNVNTRLKLVYGEQSCLKLSIVPQGGFCVSFRIPALLPEELGK